MVEKLTNSLATALMDIPAVDSLKTWDICGIVLCDKTAHFRVAFFLSPAQGDCVMIMLFNQLLDLSHL